MQRDSAAAAQLVKQLWSAPTEQPLWELVSNLEKEESGAKKMFSSENQLKRDVIRFIFGFEMSSQVLKIINAHFSLANSTF